MSNAWYRTGQNASLTNTSLFFMNKLDFFFNTQYLVITLCRPILRGRIISTNNNMALIVPFICYICKAMSCSFDKASNTLGGTKRWHFNYVYFSCRNKRCLRKSVHLPVGCSLLRTVTKTSESPSFETAHCFNKRNSSHVAHIVYAEGGCWYWEVETCPRRSGESQSARWPRLYCRARAFLRAGKH